MTILQTSLKITVIYPIKWFIHSFGDLMSLERSPHLLSS
jgi:hypothetical protein